MASETTVRKLVNRIEYKTDQASLDRANQGFGQLKAAAAVFAGFVTSRVVGSIKALAGEELQLADATAKAARNFGISTEEMSSMEEAARVSGLQVEQFRDISKDLTKNSVEAARGNKELRKEFKLIGINAKEFQRLPLPEKFEQVADALQKVRDPARRAQLRMKLMGEQGVRAGTLMDKGAAGIRAAREEAERLGLVLDQKFTDDVEALNDSMTLTEGVFRGVKREILAGMMPALMELTQGARDLLMSLNRDDLRAIGQTVGTVLKWSFEQLNGVMKFAVDNAGLLQTILVGVGGAAVVSNLANVIKLVRMIGLAGATASLKFALLAAVIAGIYLVVDDIDTFLKGGKSFTGTFLESFLGDADEVEHYRSGLMMFLEDVSSFDFGDEGFFAWFKKQLDEAAIYWSDTGLFDEMASDWEKWSGDQSWDEFVKNFKRDLKPVTDWVVGLGEDFDKTLNGPVRDAFRDGARSAVRFIKQIGNAVQTWIISKFDMVVDTINRFASKLRGLGVDVPDIASFSTGARDPALDTGAQMQRAANQAGGPGLIERVEINLPNVTDAREAARQVQEKLTGTTSDLFNAAAAYMQGAPQGG